MKKIFRTVLRCSYLSAFEARLLNDDPAAEEVDEGVRALVLDQVVLELGLDLVEEVEHELVDVLLLHVVRGLLGHSVILALKRINIRKNSFNRSELGPTFPMTPMI